MDRNQKTRRILLQGLARENHAKISYVLAEFTARTGQIFELTDNHLEAGVVPYSPDTTNSETSLWFDIAAFSGTAENTQSVESCLAGLNQILAGNWPPRFDAIGCAFRLITLLDEAGFDDSHRTRHGNLPVAALAPVRREGRCVALFDELARVFVEKLGGQVQAPSWPGGSDLAVCVTHDTDAVNWSHPLEIVYNTAKLLMRGSRLHGAMALDGLKGALGKDTDASRFFLEGRKYLDEPNVPSTYFLSVRRKVRRDLNDVRSQVDNCRTDWEALRELAANGQEFGYHPQINARNSLDEMVASKSWIEEHLEQPIFGLRHHYWSIDWRSPWLTYRKHVNAGFRYDTSMAYPDAPGFRAATAFPFRPFDPVRGRPLDLYVVPTSLMDGHILGLPASPDQYESLLSEVDEIVLNCKRNGGVLVIDWHTETALNENIYKDYFPFLLKIIMRIEETSRPWYTNTWDMIKHTHMHRKNLGVEA